jgi:preprotein translocase subunit SecG
MDVIELVGAIMLILSCILIIVIVFFQGSQKGGMSQSITGQSSDNYYQRNMGRSKEMKLKKATTVLASLFFAIAIGVNVIAAHFGGEDDVPPQGPPVDIPLPPGDDDDPAATTADESGTTADPDSTTDVPDDGTTAAPDGTTAVPDGTTAAPDNTEPVATTTE